MGFNLGKLTEDEDIELYRLERKGEKRFTLKYYPKGYEWEKHYRRSSIELLCCSNDFQEIMQTLRKHYLALLADDMSLILNDKSIAYYEVQDLINNEEEMKIEIVELNKLSFMLQLCGYQPTKKNAKKTSATKE